MKLLGKTFRLFKHKPLSLSPLAFHELAKELFFLFFFFPSFPCPLSIFLFLLFFFSSPHKNKKDMILNSIHACIYLRSNKMISPFLGASHGMEEEEDLRAAPSSLFPSLLDGNKEKRRPKMPPLSCFLPLLYDPLYAFTCVNHPRANIHLPTSPWSIFFLFAIKSLLLFFFIT